MNENIELYNLLAKTLLLGTIQLLSTTTSLLIVAIWDDWTWKTIDYCVSVICIVLMSAFMEKYYLRFLTCCCCLKSRIFKNNSNNELKQRLLIADSTKS